MALLDQFGNPIPNKRMAGFTDFFFDKLLPEMNAKIWQGYRSKRSVIVDQFGRQIVTPRQSGIGFVSTPRLIDPGPETGGVADAIGSQYIPIEE